jgi:hypothetical protein
MPVCPLDANYQLVRNVLAVTVSTTGVSSATNGHIVLIYDGRNPAFAEGGRGHAAYLETKRALRPAYAHALRRCRWQTLVGALRDAQPTSWLAAELALKYGF